MTGVQTCALPISSDFGDIVAIHIEKSGKHQITDHPAPLLYAAVIKFKIKDLFKNSEFKFYMLLVTAFTAFIMVELIAMRNYDVEHAFRSSIFQVVSFITTTGLFNDDAAVWPHVTWDKMQCSVNIKLYCQEWQKQHLGASCAIFP